MRKLHIYFYAVIAYNNVDTEVAYLKSHERADQPSILSGKAGIPMSREFERILQSIAIQNNTTVHAIRREMQAAIDEAFESPDPAARTAWKDIPFRGDRPTPEEFVAHMARKLQSHGKKP